MSMNLKFGKQAHRRFSVLGCSLVALAACSPPSTDSSTALPALPYAVEYPGIGYVRNEPEGRLGQLARAIDARDVELDFVADRGYLDAALAELAIDVSSQVLVFSRTSLQTRQIRPETPRAIYFNDDTYVAWVPDAPSLELSGYDPELGPVFYRVVQSAEEPPSMERQFGVCLRCHDTYGLAGDGAPRFLLGSGYTGVDGELVSHEAWILTSQATPLRNRWGGWYATGKHGAQVHLGNIVVEHAEDLQDLEALRVGNVDDLHGILDTSRFLTPYSDIVALMVLEHQIEVQNLISRLRFEAASAEPAPLGPHVDALLEAMLMVDEIELTDPITGSSGFTAHFESLGPFDSAGRSLRQLDLRTRLFRYPLSYLIYSDAFQALQPAAKSAVYARLREILAPGAGLAGFAELAEEDRMAIAAILRDTLPRVFDP
jgi:hypothetical protein